MNEITVRLPPAVIEEIEERVYARIERRLTVTSPYLTVKEAAAYLRCDPARIHNLLSARTLTRTKEGGRTLLLRSEVEALPVTTPRADRVYSSRG